MISFKQYGDGKWRSVDNENKVMFTSRNEPTVDTVWEDSGLTTETGYKVLVPKSATKQFDVKKLKIHNASEAGETKGVTLDFM